MPNSLAQAELIAPMNNPPFPSRWVRRVSNLELDFFHHVKEKQNGNSNKETRSEETRCEEAGS
ncbi:hypothetical protein CFU_3875 [Collimonas fungivorans Ter331]|uniref:Uncharacterized protein n=1 Tax=Collimonas fungivorans (strain Ter331) TaxID=1005048 RepID=G0ADS6_COLFT|nr:hypothetical protein CFU_3875 [Collimonas fungivorans Ter331]